MIPENEYAKLQAQSLNGFGLGGLSRNKIYVQKLHIRIVSNGFIVETFEGLEYSFNKLEDVSIFIEEYLKEKTKKEGK